MSWEKQKSGKIQFGGVGALSSSSLHVPIYPQSVPETRMSASDYLLLLQEILAAFPHHFG